MNLLEIDELRAGLRRQNESAPEEVRDENTLNPSSLTADDVEMLCAELSTQLPPGFRDLITTYEFGGLSIGGLFFGRKPYPRELLNDNRDAEYPWWGDGRRPEDLLLIAATERWLILLDAGNGEVSAYRKVDEWDSRHRVAKDFEHFVRACGTVLLAPVSRDVRDLANDVSVQSGAAGVEFWTAFTAHGG